MVKKGENLEVKKKFQERGLNLEPSCNKMDFICYDKNNDATQIVIRIIMMLIKW